MQEDHDLSTTPITTQTLQVVRELRRYILWQKEQGWSGVPLPPKEKTWQPEPLVSVFRKQTPQRSASRGFAEKDSVQGAFSNEVSPVGSKRPRFTLPEESVDVPNSSTPPSIAINSSFSSEPPPVSIDTPLVVGKVSRVSPLNVRPPLTEKEKSRLSQKMEGARAFLGDCSRCSLSEHRTHLMYGSGPVRTRLMIVFPQPSELDDRMGRSFLGPSGELVRQMIESIGVKPEDVYLAYHTKCRPPDDRHPVVKEAQACLPFVVEQIRILQPEIILAMGAIVAQSLLQTSQRLERLRGRWFAIHEGDLLPKAQHPCHMLITYHPLYLIKKPHKKIDAWEDLQRVRERLLTFEEEKLL